MNKLYMKRKCKIISHKNTYKVGLLVGNMKSLINTYAIVVETDSIRNIIRLDNNWWWHFNDLLFEKEPINVNVISTSKYYFNESLLDV